MLHSISTSKATGIDQIPGKILLKLAAPAITQSITTLFNYSIATESFPSEWQIAKVIPLHKSGARNLLDKYRPISILPAISKVFEKILYKQLFNYLNANNLIIFRNSNLVSDLCIQPLTPCCIAPMNGTQTWIMVCLILLCFWT